MQLLSRYNPERYTEEQYLIEKRIVSHALFISAALIVFLWVIKLFEVEYNLDFSTWGILPLKIKGLRGIIFSPFIHGSIGHLAANTFPLFILTFSLFFFYRKSPYLIFLLIYILSGSFVWLFGREALHIGSSGIIYGLAAYLFLSGILSRNVSQLTISLIVALVYGYLFWGIFPIKPEISWESHLWGGVSGFGMALLTWKRLPEQENNPEDDRDSEIDENEGKDEDETDFHSLS
jgi:membrane associated rhomboid family serine protease